MSNRAPELFELAQLVEHVHRPRLTFRRSVSRGVLPIRAAASSEMSTRRQLIRTWCERERKATVVAEAIQQSAARVTRRGFTVFTLIEEQPGFLAVPWIHAYSTGSLAHVDAVGHVP